MWKIGDVIAVAILILGTLGILGGVIQYMHVTTVNLERSWELRNHL